MSFRVKTIILLTVLSVSPYIVTLLLLGNVYRNDLQNRVFEDMQYQLQTVASQVNGQLEFLEKDMRFISSMDVMNDVLSGDLDKRITSILIAKKIDLGLDGDFYVVGKDRRIIAASDVSSIGSPFTHRSMLSYPIVSSFSSDPVGKLVVNYDLTTLSRRLPEGEHQQFSLVPVDLVPADSGDLLSQHTSLDRRPDLALVLTRDHDIAFALLENLQRFFATGLFIGAGIIGVIAYLIASYLVNPLLQLSRTAQLITRTEDYSQRVDIRRSDEIGTLARAFNLMLSGMEQLIARVQEEGENKLKLVQEKNRAEMLQNLSTKLSKYLSPQVYESIFSGEQDVTLTSSRKKLTVFFSDIVNFTDTTDQMESEDLTLLLNQYLREMTDIALQYGATIDKYIGDAIMIFFGDPKSHGVEEDAVLCIQMAVAMQERMAALQGSWRAQGFTRPLAIRIGIHTGYCTVGNFGTESRMDYTILGSPVNLASRIEGQAEPGSIYISEDTYLLVRNRIHCVPSKMVTPKGFSKAIQLYRVVSDTEQHSGIETFEAPGFSLTVNNELLDDTARASLRDRLKELL